MADATYINSNSFSVNYSAVSTPDIWMPGRRTQCFCGVDGYREGVIESSSVVGSNVVVVTTANSDDITINLESALFGIVGKGDSQSLPVHSHEDNLGEGGSITEAAISDLNKYTTQEVDALIAAVSGTTDHSDLNQLDFASSGHSGFASYEHLTTASGALREDITQNTTNIASVSGTLASHQHTHIIASDNSQVIVDDTPQARIILYNYGSPSTIVTATLSGVRFGTGPTISRFSIDETMGSDSNSLVPTESAVKTYVDNSVATIDHGGLTGLGDDDHTQYIRVDGTRDFTGVVRYNAAKTFNNDAQLVDKKYVDDSVTTLSGLIGNIIQDGDNSYVVVDEGNGYIYFHSNGSDSANITGVGLQLASGQRINEFSNDTTMGDSSSVAVPTEFAVKVYADGKITTHESTYDHSKLHDRLHNLASTSDHQATAHRTFYSNGSGQIAEIAHGTSGYVWTSNGSSSAPSWQAVGGSSSKIEQGDSSVEVIDTGVGVINFDVDGSTRGQFAASGLYLSTGVRINEFSNDAALSGNSSVAVPTEYAVKTYTDAKMTTHESTYDHDNLHVREHSMTGTSDHNATAHRLFFSDASGNIQELAHGTSNYVLTSNGSTSAPSWQAGGSASSPLTTKGDLWVYTTTDTRLPVGTNDYVLTADSSEAAGVKWAAVENSDKIEEGNSSVEVVDTGDGQIEFTIDGTEEVRFSDNSYLFGDAVDNSIGYNFELGSTRSRFACVTYHNTYESQFVMNSAKGTVSSPTALTDGRKVGSLNFGGYDGNSWEFSGGVFCYVDGTVSDETVPMSIEFHTSETSSPGRASRLNIRADGTVEPGADDSQDFGSSSKRWTDIYATNSTIQTSDERMKTTISGCELGLDFIDRLQPKSFKWKDYTSTVKISDEAGDTTKEIQHTHHRKHYGMIAQDVMTTLSGLSIDSENFAGITYDEDADIYGLRYTEFIAPMIKAIKELKARVEELENAG